MNELIKDTSNLTPIEIALGIDENGMTTAKGLYQFLELNPAHYSRWCKNNITENEFAEENADFWAFTPNGEREFNPNPTQDFKLTARFAKKLSMTQKNERGEGAREYFTLMEDMAKEITLQKRNMPREQLLNEQPTPQPDTLTTADRIKMMELIATCPPEALEYVAGMAKPFMTDRKPLVCTNLASAQVATAAPATIVAPVKEKMSTSGYMEPFNLSKLSNHLKRTGTTRSELAKRSGIDCSQIRRYLGGANRPGRDSRDKMCIALGKPRTWLDM